MFLTGLVILSAIFFWYRSQKVDSVASVKGILDIGSQLQAAYEQGLDDKNFQYNLKSCGLEASEQADLGRDFYQCSPWLLDCRLRSQKKWKANGVEFKVVNSNDQMFSFVGPSVIESKHIPHEGLLITLRTAGLKKKDYQIVVVNNCEKSVYLPQRKYALRNKSKEVFYWDNKNRHIFIDKYQVSWWDVIWWSRLQKRNLSVSPPLDSRDWVYPANGLSKSEMHRFCADKGKQILSAAVFDAVTNYPIDDELFPGRIYLSPYPWTHKRKSFLSNNEKSLSQSDCDKAFVKGCSPKNKFSINKGEMPTWTSISAGLGFYMEYMRNSAFPEENLKFSSYLLPRLSSWHHLGKRIHWHDDQATGQNIDFPDEHLDMKALDKMPIAFRCMRYAY